MNTSSSATNVSSFVFCPKTRGKKNACIEDTHSPDQPTRAAERDAVDSGSQHEDKYPGHSIGVHTCMLMISLGIVEKSEANDVTS